MNMNSMVKELSEYNNNPVSGGVVVYRDDVSRVVVSELLSLHSDGSLVSGERVVDTASQLLCTQTDL